ncbi:MAG: TlpA family protein disulfide reductase [Candidatus Thioglobus sp.]|nr:TlpA family protein disulfide reductase [Candidatus Thioglobus pontius]MBL6984782.1 TlpA family protein disulfide reductase [Candidatus Thioglobus sp.]
MKWLILIVTFFSATLYAGEKFDVELSSGDVITIDSYPGEGKVLYLQLPSERGLGKGYVTTAQQLAFENHTLWAVDLHSSYMVAPRRSSIDKFNVNDLLELVDYSKAQGFKQLFFIASGRGAQLALKVANQWQLDNPNSNYLKGHLLHSPHLILGKPQLGTNAQYVDVARVSNLPVYLILPEYGTKYFRAEEIVQALKKGGSSVFTHRLKGVSGGFHMRNEQDLSKVSLQEKDALADTYLLASNLLLTVTPPKPLIIKKTNKKTTELSFSEPVLKPYVQKQSINLVLNNLIGEKVSLDQYRGKVVLLNFWASWCKPCVEEVPSLARLNEKLKATDFQILTINVGESKQQINEFMKKVPFDLPILLDESGIAVKNWGVYAYPSNFLLDKNGTIRYVYRGALEWDAPNIVKTISQLL